MINPLDFKSIKRSVTMESVLRHYQVQLRRSGKDQYRGLLPDSSGRRARRFSREFGAQHFPLLRVRRRRNRAGLRCCDGGLLFVRGSTKAAGHDLLVDAVELDTEWEGTGYGKKKGFFTPEVQADWHRLRSSLSGRTRNYRKDSDRVWSRLLRRARIDAWAIGHSYPQR